ncbi:biotin--[acetyl-CoA-carboxylase] ligase [Methanobrevibacter filiformis]|uniref:Bifunctional ligase/repressor BirA n=1 Tax=Methanobrevibacter filiformis TaxID=55758 RepID=A0A166C1Z9_9EURY|nr:biotin--[acetyl-CoA-carboxylase] ligase [Methanobrevibacter filiformis]KZX10717.1 bifunctional ligase/repressor BirA [Methanobrevibacter filiformis]
MNKDMLEILSKHEDKVTKYADSISDIDEKEVALIIKEIGNIHTIKDSNIKDCLKTETIGKEIFYFKEVNSTNSVAKFLAKNGTDDGAVVLSEVQLNGKGRRGKKWESPSGGVWLSIILKPKISPSKASLITLATGVVVAKTLKAMGVDAKIKWPNDILINNKKVCGILTEAHANYKSVDYVIVGIGIDTNLNLDILPPIIKEGTTSLKKELKKDIDDNEIIYTFLNEFELMYEKFQKEKFEDILNEWRLLTQTIGSYVEIKQPFGKILKGHAVGITNSGALIIESENGELTKVISGECAIKTN